MEKKAYMIPSFVEIKLESRDTLRGFTAPSDVNQVGVIRRIGPIGNLGGGAGALGGTGSLGSTGSVK